MRGRVCTGRPEGHMKASNAMELACGRLEGPGGQVTVTALATKVAQGQESETGKYLLSKSKSKSKTKSKKPESPCASRAAKKACVSASSKIDSYSDQADEAAACVVTRAQSVEWTSVAVRSAPSLPEPLMSKDGIGAGTHTGGFLCWWKCKGTQKT